MSNETIESKIERAAQDISVCIAATLLELTTPLAKKYELTDGQLAVAIVVAQMRLLAGGAAGVIVGNTGVDSEMEAKVAELLRGIRPVIAAALEIKD